MFSEYVHTEESASGNITSGKPSKMISIVAKSYHRITGLQKSQS